MRRIIVFIIFLGILIIASACHTEGCTDPQSINYDPEASENDGSCKYKGEAIFWVDSSFNFIDISIFFTGKIIGVIDGYYSHEPACGAEHGLSIKLDPGIYEFTAVDTLGATYTDTIHIRANGCSAKKICMDSLQ